MHELIKKFLEDDVVPEYSIEPVIIESNCNNDKYIKINLDIEQAQYIIKNKDGEWVEIETLPINKNLKVELDHLRWEAYNFVFYREVNCEELNNTGKEYTEEDDIAFKKSLDLIKKHDILGIELGKKLKLELPNDWTVVYANVSDSNEIIM